ncbi:MAG: DNA polymerase III subunit delta [Ignavibacteria bacterium]|nr:DNA polymerase III subunit delta [Ignavibacteria bacterium]MCC7158655.1 DNA polymerase III subunit delta [Ignavibacteria bacterium]
MKTFLDFQTEVNAGKVGNVYFVAASDGYFVQKASELLREKLFGSSESRDNFFLRYADDTLLNELFDLCSNFASLFSSQKIIILKKCEKYSRKLSELREFVKKPEADTYLMLVFDKEYILEKKLDKEIDFYDFSELPQRTLYEWVRKEFENRHMQIKNDALELLITSVPSSFDLLISEIEKISNYDFSASEPVITKELILQFTGYDKEYSPDELIYSIVKKDRKKAYTIIDNLLNSKGLNEIYLLSIISNYYMDLISFKSKGLDAMDTRLLYQKYRLWGDRVKFAKNYHKLINIQSLEQSFEKILNTDKKLKTSMLDSKILMTSLVEELINA